MSAAAPARQQTRQLAPHEEQWRALCGKNFIIVPRGMAQLLRTFKSLTEAILFFEVTERTCCAPTASEKPREVELPESKAAEVAGTSENQAATALKDLTERKVLLRHRHGRTNAYAVNLEVWGKLPKRPRRTITPKPLAIEPDDADAEASVLEPGARRAAFTIAPGGARTVAVPAALAKEVLVVLPGEGRVRLLSETCPHGRECALAGGGDTSSKGVVSVGDSKRKPQLQLGGPIRLADRVSPIVPIRGHVAASVDDVLAKRVDSAGDPDQKPQLELALSTEFAAFQADVLALAGSQIQAPPPTGLIQRIYGSLSREGIDPDKFRARLNARRSKVHSWGMLDHLLEDVLGLARKENEAKAAEEAAADVQRRAKTRSAIGDYLNALRDIDGLKPILSKLHALLHQADEGVELNLLHEGWLSIDRELLDHLLELRTEAERAEVQAQLHYWAKQGITSDIASRRVKRDALSRILFDVGSLPEPCWE